MPPCRMTNILGDDRRQQVLALGQLGWPLGRIEQATGVRRETASAYLTAAGIAIRGPRRRRPPRRPASQVSTDSARLPLDLADLPAWPPPSRAPTASACKSYREPVTGSSWGELVTVTSDLRPPRQLIIQGYRSEGLGAP